MSHTILEDVAELKTKYPEQVHFILGNHELAELTDYPDPEEQADAQSVSFGWDCSRCTGRPPRESTRRIARFLRTLPAGGAAAAGRVHFAQPARGRRRRRIRPVGPRRATSRPTTTASGSDVFRLVWGRDYRRENARAFAELVGAKVLINGHEPCHEGFIAPNDLQIILDCCGDKAAYVILPVGVELSHAEIMERVERLEE